MTGIEICINCPCIHTCLRPEIAPKPSTDINCIWNGVTYVEKERQTIIEEVEPC